MWAVIDIGSNTIRLVIYSMENGRLNPMLNKKYPAGLAGYIDENNEIIGYKFVSLGKFTDFIKKGDTPNEAWEKAQGQYGRVDDAVKIIDPRQE